MAFEPTATTISFNIDAHSDSDVAPTVLAVRELGPNEAVSSLSASSPDHRAFLWGLEEDRAAVSAGVV